MTFEEDRADLARHARVAAERVSLNYMLLDDAEAQVLEYVYIDPSERPGYDAEVSWWLVDEEASGPLRTSVDRFVFA